MEPGRKVERGRSQEFNVEQIEGQVCLREPVVKTMLDPRFEVRAQLGSQFDLFEASRSTN